MFVYAGCSKMFGEGGVLWDVMRALFWQCALHCLQQAV